MKIHILIIAAMIFCHPAKTQEKQETGFPDKMQWFSDAKLGIFIHWGIYSNGKTSESWAFHNRQVSHSDYMEQIKYFTAEKYDPSAWAALIRKSGAHYAVITSMHHDGIALWNTTWSDMDIPDASPAKKDVLSPFFEALRRENLKTGLYYSLIDWSDYFYPGYLKDSSRYAIADQPERWQQFLQRCHGKISELMDLYNPDLIWFDGDWEHSAEEWQAEKIRKLIQDKNSNTIINGRLQGYGDYETPEQNFPVTRPDMKYWELCMTTNDSWGYQEADTAWKTPCEIISIFADCISFGGNLLLDIGPKADGTIPAEQEYILTELGKWTGKHSEAIFGTMGGLPQGHFYGPTTLSKDSTLIFLFLQGKQCGNVVLKGLNNKIIRITVVGNNTPLSHKLVGKISWSSVPGLVYIDIPEGVQDEYMTVLKVRLDGPVSLYRGKGGL